MEQVAEHVIIGVDPHKLSATIEVVDAHEKLSWDVRLHEHEADRLASLRSYQVLDSAPDETFDMLTGLAARVRHAPISIISLVGQDRQWFLSRHGM